MKEIFKERLRETREKMGLTQKEFAEKARISSSSYNSYEQGLKTPPLSSAVKIATEMGVSLDWLCGISSENGPVTFADTAKALVALDETLGLDVQVIPDGRAENDQAQKHFIVLVLAEPDLHSDENSVSDNNVNKRYWSFLESLSETQRAVESKAIDRKYLTPWYHEQYEKLNIPLSQCRRKWKNESLGKNDYKIEVHRSFSDYPPGKTQQSDGKEREKYAE